MAKNIYDVIGDSVKEFGRDVCTDMIEKAADIPVNAVGCYTLGTSTGFKWLTEEWAKVWVGNKVALTIPATIAKWMGCNDLPDKGACDLYSKNYDFGQDYLRWTSVSNLGDCQSMCKST